MSLYARYETSNKLSIKGAPVKFPANEDGSFPTFFIARAHSSNQLFAKACKSNYEKGIPNMSEEELLEANLAIFLDANLIGWENILDRKGKVLPFSKENAKTLLTDLPEVFEKLQREASELSNYLKSAEEKAVKNS